MRKVISLVILVMLVIGLKAQIIDHTSLLPDELLVGDTVVTNMPAQVNRYVELPKDVLDSIAAVEDSIAIADSIAAVLDSIAVKDSLDQVKALAARKPLKPVPPYMRQAVYRSWRRSHPTLPGIPPYRTRTRMAKYMADTLRRAVDNMPLDTSNTDMLYLYDMRLPVINSGYVPADSSLRFHEQVSKMEASTLDEMMSIPHFEEEYERQQRNEQQRHLVRYNYASQDPRRFRYVRRRFEVPTTASRAIDSRASVQDTRIVEDLDIDFSHADLDYFGQSAIIKADKWHWKGDHTLTMQQTALSDNWYKSGDNNMSLSGDQKITVSRYDEEQITTFETILELKLSGYYTKADTVHRMRVNDNEFTLTSKYGYKAWKKWYYTAQLYGKTPIFDYYATNSNVCKSTFLSPLELNLSLGVDYKYTSPNKRFVYSLLLAPFSYDMKYVRDDRVNVKQYGIDEGKNMLHSFGSSLTTKFDWKISDDISWSSRLYYFTSYDMLKVEYENTINFKISRFFTGKFYAYPRFDDSRDRKREIKEMLTIGFSYQW
ncbi:MAG: DUF3078 domain-containing protein [Bacteroidales bacterium]|nr:DUF3078 domain-containing protein [Bacteroidales bacterium]